MTPDNTDTKSPFGPELVSATELDFSEFGTGDVVTFRYWSVSSKRPIPDVGTVVATDPGSPTTMPGAYDASSITVKNEAGKACTIYANGRVDSHYRNTSAGRNIGHDARIRINTTAAEDD